jgi:predicted transcriptional regulator
MLIKLAEANILIGIFCKKTIIKWYIFTSVMNDLREIKLRRKRLGITQGELARHANVSQSLIAKIEAGNIDPSYTLAIKIFESLNGLERNQDILCKDIMNTKIIFLDPDDSVLDAVKKMRKFDISQLPIMKYDKVVGYLSESILLDNIIKEGVDSMTVAQIMNDNPPTVPVNASKDMAASLLKFFPIVVVVQGGRPVGVITKADLLNSLYH